MTESSDKTRFLCAVRRCQQGEKTALLSGLSETDWNRLLDLSDRCFLTPYIFRNLEKSMEELRIPPPIQERMKRIYYASAAKYIGWFAELKKILSEFRRRNIPIIVLKGAHLAELVYGNLALRAMDDIDLLVKKVDFAGAEAVLRGASPEFSGKKIPMELHLDIVYPHCSVKTDIVKIWERAQPVEIAGETVLALAPEDLLFHLCLHLSLGHLFDHGGLRGLVDVAETISHFNPDWERFTAAADEHKVRNACFMTLFLTQDLLKVDIPPAVMERLKPAEMDEEFIAWCRRRVFKEEEIYSPSRNVDSFWTSKSVFERISLLLKVVFPAPENLSEKYHTALRKPGIYRFYLRHFRDLVYHHGANMFRLFRGDKRMQRVVNIVEWLARE